MKKAFTLIETIIVISVIGLVIPAIFTIVFGLVRQQTKIYRLSTVKTEGDYILNIIAATIRNSALTIYSAGPPTSANEVCDVIETYTSTTNRLIFEDRWGSWFRILLSSEKISSYSSVTAASLDLNSNKTIVSGFSIGCSRNFDYSSPTVSLSFDICYDTGAGTCASTLPEETATLHYQTKIKLRNF